ncbi:MAG TPA: NAD(P)/FAD-dependent oxidoreductase [Acidimicrobiales bacterium]|nr:NAD(P)/FAD-dependent oxidoreductase [Acidimicrobiales bacterium]
MWDAVVVGGGPAGLSAATWLARYRRRTLVLDAGEHRNRTVEATHGYFTRDGESPSSILHAATADLDAYECIERRDGEVVDIDGECGAFRVRTGDGPAIETRRVVLATGVVDAVPDLEGFDEHYGASVFHCPSCDGYEAAERHVVVLGWNAQVAGFALELLDWASSVTVVTDGRRFEGDDREHEAMADHGVTLVEDDAVALVGDRGDLRSVRLSGGNELPCGMAFFSLGHQPRTQLAEKLGCERTGEGNLVVDEHGQTTVSGVYAAGDVTPGFQLLQVATAKGTTAGVGCALSLRREPPPPEGPSRAPDVEATLNGE